MAPSCRFFQVGWGAFIDLFVLTEKALILTKFNRKMEHT